MWRLAGIAVAAPKRGGRRTHVARERRRDDVAEIIFTSGATADPKGVVITHRNILANIVPVEREVLKYRRWGRPFFPLRFLNLLPLSHLFGQAMATFIPPMLPGTVIFMRGYNPVEIVEQIKRRKVSVLVSVPKILDVLKEHVLRVAPDPPIPGPKQHVARRWWRYRKSHRAFGPKFWSFVVGAAPLDGALEAFWGELGFVVIQGYGLTETAPIVTLNHPFGTKKGSVGKAIAGVEVKVAPDGEILVRGDNVTRATTARPKPARPSRRRLHTGDIGGTEAGPHLHQGREGDDRHAEGLNVFLGTWARCAALPAKDAVVDGPGPARARPRVVVPDPGVGRASISTPSATRQPGARRSPKIPRLGVAGPELCPHRRHAQAKRREVKRWVDGARRRRPQPIAAPPPSSPRCSASPAADIDRRRSRRWLSSLGRVELLMALEHAQTTIDEAPREARRSAIWHGWRRRRERGRKRRSRSEAGGAASAGRRRRRATGRGRSPSRPNRRWPFTWVRNASLPTWILPIGRIFAGEGKARAPPGPARSSRSPPTPEPPGRPHDPVVAAAPLALSGGH